jgi:hypothetical protein
LSLWQGASEPGAFLATKNQKGKTMTKEKTIAQTMQTFMVSGPSVKEFPNYKTLNDAVGKAHGLAEGKCQALAGEKAWQWHADTTTGTWRKASPEEVEAKRTTAAGKAHGGPRSKVMTAEDRSALDAQVTALETVNNPALAPLLAGLKARQETDDLARKGSLKDRLATAIDKLGLEKVVAILEAQVVEAPAETDADEAQA